MRYTLSEGASPVIAPASAVQLYGVEKSVPAAFTANATSTAAHKENSHNVESELKKIGLRLINVNVTDITDESGYIEALGKEAAARAINDAKISVAEKNRDGSIGQANAQKDERINVASANATAINGENEAKAAIAQSDATRREREAEAARRAVAAENVAKAKALEESYVAQKRAEETRAERELATQKADVIVKAEIEKQRIEIEKMRLH